MIIWYPNDFFYRAKFTVISKGFDAVDARFFSLLHEWSKNGAHGKLWTILIEKVKRKHIKLTTKTAVHWIAFILFSSVSAYWTKIQYLTQIELQANIGYMEFAIIKKK